LAWSIDTCHEPRSPVMRALVLINWEGRSRTKFNDAIVTNQEPWHGNLRCCFYDSLHLLGPTRPHILTYVDVDDLLVMFLFSGRFDDSRLKMTTERKLTAGNV
jgi:hypothetical protein